MSGKNLGPAIIERSEYIKLVLSEHLHQPDTYSNLTKEAALTQLDSMKQLASELYCEHATNLDEHSIDYFRHFLLKIPTNLRIPQFYGMAKVHKMKVPTPMRPVISQCGSFTTYISTWLDTMLQPFTKYLPTYLKNSNDLLGIIDKLPPLPLTARIVTTDAVSMYTNISTQEGIATLREYLNKYAAEYNSQFPTTLVCDLIEIVMNNNIFEFGDTWWQQQNDTAMGTPCACIYATLFFGFHKRNLLLQKYKNNIILFKRQIDDIFLI